MYRFSRRVWNSRLLIMRQLHRLVDPQQVALRRRRPDGRHAFLDGRVRQHRRLDDGRRASFFSGDWNTAFMISGLSAGGSFCSACSTVLRVVALEQRQVAVAFGPPAPRPPRLLRDRREHVRGRVVRRHRRPVRVRRVGEAGPRVGVSVHVEDLPPREDVFLLQQLGHFNIDPVAEKMAGTPGAGPKNAAYQADEQDAPRHPLLFSHFPQPVRRQRLPAG